MFAKYLYMRVLIEILSLSGHPRTSLHASASINFLITFHAGGEQRVVNKKEIISIAAFSAGEKNRRQQKNRRADEDQVGNVISNIACNSLIYSRCRSDALLVTLRPMEGVTKFLMQFSVRVKFTGKRQFPYRGRGRPNETTKFSAGLSFNFTNSHRK